MLFRGIGENKTRPLYIIYEHVIRKLGRQHTRAPVAANILQIVHINLFDLNFSHVTPPFALGIIIIYQ